MIKRKRAAKLSAATTFRTGFAGSGSAICLSGAMDTSGATDPFSRIFVYVDGLEDPWQYEERDFLATSVCGWADPAKPGKRYFVALSEDGEVVIFSPTPVSERIADAGIRHSAAAGYGYLNCVRQIGKRLYASGFSGQVYRRERPGEWIHFDKGLLQPGAGVDAKYFASVIDGPSEKEIYVAGCEFSDGFPPRADYWNGRRWTRLELPSSASRITNVFVESPEKIWMCGDNGTLLVGSASSGFSTAGPSRGSQLFLSVTRFGDLYYLGSNLGLFQIDMEAPKRVFRKVRTRLVPELVDANIVQAVSGVLWSMGPKDIARFDGERWERIHHPDNPPIGGV